MRTVPMVEAGHPVPDAAGLKAAERTLALADGADEDDLVLVLMSGGASANWIAPARGVSFADKQAVTRALLRSGAEIGEINTVRKHLSRIKGGRLAAPRFPAKLVDHRDFRRARRRSVGDRLRPDGARPDDARRRARNRRRIPTRSARRAYRARSTMSAMKRPSPATRHSRHEIRSGAGRPTHFARRRRRARRRLRMRLAWRQVEGEAREVAAEPRQAGARTRAQGKRAGRSSRAAN